MSGTQIKYNQTIVGWFNVTLVETGATYNIEPQRFYEITGVSRDAVSGCKGIDGKQLVALLTCRSVRSIRRAVAV